MPSKKKVFQTRPVSKTVHRAVNTTEEREESLRDMVDSGRLSHPHTSNSAFESPTTVTESSSSSTLHREFQHPKPLDSARQKQAMGLVWPDGTPNHVQRTKSPVQIQRSTLIQRNGSDDEKESTAGGRYGGGTVLSTEDVIFIKQQTGRYPSQQDMQQARPYAVRLYNKYGDEFDETLRSCVVFLMKGMDLDKIIGGLN
ncbi:MAG: hypothetical protein AAF639_25705 [Chloroflexota bacterium]